MPTWGGVAGKRVHERRVTPSVEAQDREAARRLWQVSEEEIQASAGGHA